MIINDIYIYIYKLPVLPLYTCIFNLYYFNLLIYFYFEACVVMAADRNLGPLCYAHSIMVKQNKHKKVMIVIS